MANRVKQFLESIVFAGMGQGGAKAPAKSLRWLGPLAGPVDRFLSGSKPLDPLYLSNQTATQRFKRAALISLPVLAIVALVAVALILKPTAATKAQREPTTAEIAASSLPNLAKDIKIEVNHDVQVVEAVVRPGPSPKLVGTVRNNTDRRFRSVRLVFEVTDSQGSQVGAVSTTVRDLAARATADFEIPLKQLDAAFVIVREARAE